MQAKIDKTKLQGLGNVRHLMYKLIQEALRRPTLHEIVGRDLSQKIFNMEYSYLNEKERNQFDQMLFTIALEQGSVLVLGSNVLSEGEQRDLKNCYEALKKSLEKEVGRPDLSESDNVVVTEELHKYYGEEFEVVRVYYSEQGEIGWWVDGKNALGIVPIKAEYITKKGVSQYE